MHRDWDSHWGTMSRTIFYSIVKIEQASTSWTIAILKQLHKGRVCVSLWGEEMLHSHGQKSPTASCSKCSLDFVPVSKRITNELVSK